MMKKGKPDKLKSVFDKFTDIVLSPFTLDMEGYTKAYGDLFNKVTDSLFIGARPDETAVPALKAAGITHVVSCLDAYEQSRISIKCTFHFRFQSFNRFFSRIADSMIP